MAGSRGLLVEDADWTRACYGRLALYGAGWLRHSWDRLSEADRTHLGGENPFPECFLLALNS